MSSDDSNPSRRTNQDGEEHNPFVAFRRFADEQVAAIFQGLSELPVALADLRQRFDDAESAALKSFNRNYERATNPERKRIEPRSEGDGTASTREEEKEEARIAAIWERAARTCPGMRADPMFNNEGKTEDYAGAWSKALTEDKKSVGSTVERKDHGPRYNQNHGSATAQPFTWRPSLDYLMRSPYSPLHLELSHEEANPSPQWRDAFEDLLVATGSGQLPDVRARIDGKGSRSANDWLSSLVHRDLVDVSFGLSAMSQLFFSPIAALLGPFENFTQNDNHETELDQYERTFGRQLRPAPESQTNSLTSRTTLSEDSQEAHAKPSVVATLTSTERHVLADGTVTTKTVLKRRFADGREESEEKTETTHATPKTSQVVEYGKEAEGHRPLVGEQQKNGSWFWS